jgi:hypothetical protein
MRQPIGRSPGRGGPAAALTGAGVSRISSVSELEEILPPDRGRFIAPAWHFASGLILLATMLTIRSAGGAEPPTLEEHALAIERASEAPDGIVSSSAISRVS